MSFYHSIPQQRGCASTIARPELRLLNAIKRDLNTNYELKFSLLTFGTYAPYAPARRTEMAALRQADDMREYLGLAQPGGKIEKDVSSILARIASTKGITTTTTAAATTETMALRSKSIATATGKIEKMSLLRAIGTGFMVIPTALLQVLYNFVTTRVAWMIWTTYMLAIMAILLWASQGLVYLPIVTQVRRRVWVEELGQHYGLSDAISNVLRILIRCVRWILIAPFLAVGALYRLICQNDSCKALLHLCRAKIALLSDWLHCWYLGLRYSATIDTIRLRYSIITAWFNRNLFRLFWACLFAALAWRLRDVTFGKDVREGIIRFESMKEMAAYYGVPQDHFLHDRDGAFNARPWEWDWEASMDRRGDEMLGREVPVQRIDVLSERRDEEGLEAVEEVVEDVQSTPDEEEILVGGRESTKRVVQDGMVAYCRRCRQRHCCEAVDEETKSRWPVSAALRAMDLGLRYPSVR